MGEEDAAYLLSRAIQFFTPGVPQVYYMGLLAGPNDYELMERTRYDRNISRHNYTLEEIEECAKKPVVRRLRRLMQFRNEYPVFDGEMQVPDTADGELVIRWKDGERKVVLHAVLSDRSFVIKYLDRKGQERELNLDEDFEW
mgnify:FL=1